MQEHENWRSSFRIAKYSVSWGSPCSKKRATRWKNASFFSSIFHRFFVKNRRKIAQKAWTTALRTKIEKNPGSERLFLAKNRFLVDFWEFSGSPGASRDVPGASQNRSFFQQFRVSSENVLGRSPGRPPGGPEAPPGYHFGSIFGRFCMSNDVEKMSKNVTETWTKTISKSRKQPNSD